jgi:hypothetical protein
MACESVLKMVFFVLAVLEWHQWWEAVPIDGGCRVPVSGTTVWCVTVQLPPHQCTICGVLPYCHHHNSAPSIFRSQEEYEQVCSRHVTSSLLGRGVNFLCVGALSIVFRVGPEQISGCLVGTLDRGTCAEVSRSPGEFRSGVRAQVRGWVSFAAGSRY